MTLSLTLSVPQVRASGSAAPPAAITSLTIMGATPLLDATNDYSDATARTGVNGDGWVGKIVMPYIVAATLDPTKITINLSDPGYDATGTTTVSRTIRGGKILRRQYNAAGSAQDSNNGTTETVFFSLIADNGEFATVYQGTTIVSASAASGFYGAAASGGVSTLVNSSTRAYPKPGWTWAMRQHVRSTGSGLVVEGVAMHKHAMNGRQVARVEYIAADASAHPAATQTVSTPTLSTYCTKGQKPEVYAATIPETALTQGDLCLVNAKVYPWLGDSSAILDLVADGINVTGNLTTGNPQTPLRFLCDKSGTYGGAQVWVKKGFAGTHAVGSSSTPYADVFAALRALPAYNTANKTANVSHAGATIWIMDDGSGGAVLDHKIVGDVDSVVVGKCLTEIREWTGNTAAVAIDVDSSFHLVCSMLSWHVDVTQNAGSVGWLTSFAGTSMPLTYYCDKTHNYVRGDLTHNLQQLCGALNLTITASGYVSGGDPHFAVGGTTADPTESVLLMGVVNHALNSAKQVRNRAVLGCDFLNAYVDELDPTVVTSLATSDGKIVVNNKFLRADNGWICGQAVTYGPRGLFIGQNIIERAVGTLQGALGVGNDSCVQPLDNVVVTANTVVGDRTNWFYTDVAGAVGVVKRGATRMNLCDQVNTKSDLFTTNTTTKGRVGNWSHIHGIDNWDMSLDGDSNHVGVPATGAWLGEYWANPAMCRVTRVAVTFTADQSQQGTNTGGGTYTLTGATNPAYDAVPTGFAPFKYDQAGTARYNNGRGCMGALETLTGARV